MINSGKELREYQEREQPTFTEIARNFIREDHTARPIITIDDQDSGRVLLVSIKAELETNTSHSPALYLGNPRFEVIAPDQAYFAITGDRRDAEEFPILVGEHSGELPIETTKRKVYAHAHDSPNRVIPGYELARFMAKCLSSPIRYTTGESDSLRPRRIEALLVSNPLKENRLPIESHPKIKIYELALNTTGTQLEVKGMIPGISHPAYFASRPEIWDVYKDNLNHLKGKRKGNLDDKITAAIAAVLFSASTNRLNLEQTDPHETIVIPASLIDVVTVPFVPPPGNKSRVRYDPELIKPLLNRAKEFLT